MLHDTTAARAAAAAERRTSPRLQCTAELVVAWHHDLEIPVRYRLVDVGDGGYRIRSSAPMITGMTGTALRLLPEGVTLNHSLLVTWISEPFASGEYEIGLRRL